MTQISEAPGHAHDKVGGSPSPVSVAADGIEEAVLAVRDAQPGWAAVAAAERGAMLHRAANAVRAAADELATMLERETGRPRASGRDGVLAGAATLDQYAELGPVHRGRALQGDRTASDFMIPQPRGVVLALTPWNDPVAIACGLLGAALVTGNAVLHKPSERCSRTGALLGRLLAEHLPDSVIRTVGGGADTGALLSASSLVDVIAHVGSSETGRRISAAAARTGAKVLLENGGNDPLLIDADVDPEWAAEQAALGAFANAGQICTSVERIYVHAQIADAFIDALCARAREWNSDPQPLVDARQRAQVHDQVTDAESRGARVLVGGRIPEGEGAVYPATVLVDCSPDMTIMREETFGPVAPVRVVPDFEAGLAQARSGDYGLAATVLTASMANAQRAWHELPVGTVKVNAVFGGAPGGAAQPRGRSGTGYGYGPELLDEMTTMKVVHMQSPPLARPDRAHSSS
ncbi:aldehyde dehydrogenase family protein [Nocardia cyriacigeorgica]|uniref:aldehyde dehydrogenase family protein n=1 Tax=Nocardia cyriacigeorgica TaxID=135487 RepID=UPI0013D3CED9|nr:aldehyde dehydrogenase family protein [Nocardia cyriacigeorgica]NEW28377.1 aldehyde dehydrogenase family protein [Nocardia cyriacigeorgica]